VVPLITGKPVEAQDINDDNFIVPWFSAKAQQNQVRKRRSGDWEAREARGRSFCFIYI